MPLWRWSKTAATNASADPTINWSEGQPPSSVNDSARGMMASVAQYRDDISGALVTSGTGTAYSITSNSGFGALADMNGTLIAFTPHVMNGATVTLNVDGLGAKPLRLGPSLELQSNILLAGTPYMATYNHADQVFYLHGLGTSAYGIPLGAGMDYWDDTTPSSAFAFPVGQAIPRTGIYAPLFAKFGTKYGSGDGSTTFNLPDKRGRSSYAKDNMGGTQANRLTFANGGIDGTSLGGNGGSEYIFIAQGNLPNANLAFTGVADPVSVTSSANTVLQGAVSYGAQAGGDSILRATAASNIISGGVFTPRGLISSINGGVTQQSTRTLSPAIVCNYIMRVI